MGLLKLIYAWFHMIRLPILFLCSFGAIVGALNCSVFLNVELSSFQILLILLGSAFLSTGTMFHNDITDLESDKVNRPNKPVPAGKLREKTVFYTGLLLMVSSIIIALFINYKDYGTINWNLGAHTFILVLVGLYYNYYGKHHGIFGHMAVAFGVGSIPYWGGLAAFPNELTLLLPLSVAIFFQEIGREIMVCAGDYIGDLKAGFKTLPVKLGRKRSMQIAVLFYIIFIPIFTLSVYDWTGLGTPKIFGSLYLIGGVLLAISLLSTWLLTYVVVVKTDDEKKIWNTFERYERTGTRVMIIVFQIFIFLEVFY